MGVREPCDGFVGALGARQGAMRPFLMLFLLGGQLPRAPSSGGIETSGYPSTDYSVKTKKTPRMTERFQAIELVGFNQLSIGQLLHRSRYAPILAEHLN